MNLLASAILVTNFLLLIRALLRHSNRGIDPEELQQEIHQPKEDEHRRTADEQALPSVDGITRRLQPPKPDARPKEKVTASPTSAAGQSHCPACGATITVHDERCPSCEICFVADGSPKWTLGAVGPADGIYLPPTDISK